MRLILSAERSGLSGQPGLRAKKVADITHPLGPRGRSILWWGPGVFAGARRRPVSALGSSCLACEHSSEYAFLQLRTLYGSHMTQS